MASGGPSFPNRLGYVLFGIDDTRLRATWRFVLAWPLLPLVGALVALVMPLMGLSGMIPGGPLQGIIFLGILLLWARFIDRRPLSDYGVSGSRSWLLNLFVGFVAVVGVWIGWHALASSVGWMQIESAMTGSPGSLLFGLGGRLVSLAINTWVQDVAFFAIILASAAEGLHSRDIGPTEAVLGAWVVAVLFFTATRDANRARCGRRCGLRPPVRPHWRVGADHRGPLGRELCGGDDLRVSGHGEGGPGHPRDQPDTSWGRRRGGSDPVVCRHVPSPPRVASVV